MEKYRKKRLLIYKCIHVTESLCCIPEINTIFHTNCTSIKKYIFKKRFQLRRGVNKKWRNAGPFQGANMPWNGSWLRREFMLEKSYMNVMNVVKFSHGMHPLHNIWKFILEKNPTHVLNVTKPLVGAFPSFYIR